MKGDGELGSWGWWYGVGLGDVGGGCWVGICVGNGGVGGWRGGGGVVLVGWWGRGWVLGVWGGWGGFVDVVGGEE